MVSPYLTMKPRSEQDVRLRPFCKTCGWRKGGADSWNGAACKCGHSASPIELIPASVSEHRAAIAKVDSRAAMTLEATQ